MRFCWFSLCYRPFQQPTHSIDKLLLTSRDNCWKIPDLESTLARSKVRRPRRHSIFKFFLVVVVCSLFFCNENSDAAGKNLMGRLIFELLST